MQRELKLWSICLFTLLFVLMTSFAYSQDTGDEAKSLEERLAALEEKSDEALDLAKGFEFNGYARAGAALTDKGGSATNENDFQPFRLNGAPAKWRLGNESDTYVELRFSKVWENDDGSTFRATFQPTFKEGNDRDWVEYGGDDAKFTLRQAYVEATNAFEKGLNFWAGQRFYRRADIHVTDFYYNHPVGFGGGVQDIELGEFSKLAVAWINTSRGSDLVTDEGEYSVNNIYFDLYEIALGPGTLDLQVAPSWTSGGTYTDEENDTETEIDDFTGFQTTVQYNLESFFGVKEGGFSKIFAQYGSGAGVNFFSGSAGALFAFGDWNDFTNEDAEDQNRIRAGAFGVLELSDKFQIMPALVWEVFDNGASSDSNTTWISAGFRPKYNITNNFAFQFEYGFDHIDDEAADDSTYLHKFTVAPTITMGSGFWARPELRAFVTYANWSDEGAIGGTLWEDDTEGMLYGVQMEVWW